MSGTPVVAALAGGPEAALTDSAIPAHSAGKVDPETLVLRGDPRRVVRFRREVIVGISAAVAIAIAATSWIALNPASFKTAALGDDMFKARAERQPEALAKAPGSYDAIPKLGPPLPGDLGRPILEHQRKLEAPHSSAEEATAAAAISARERELAEQAAARQSAILMQVGSGRSGPASSSLVGDDRRAPDPALERTREARTEQAVDAVNAYRIQEPASPWIVTAGSILSASLITGVNSDLPGTVIAQITENAFDSITGKTLLIPQGARLVGRYDNDVAHGQRRALVVWHRIIWPDGTSLRIDDMPASDAAGYAGIADRVDFHGGALVKGVALSTILGVGTELSLGSSESELVTALRESAQTSGARAGDRLVERSLDIKPTVKIRPGWPVRVMITKDLVLKPWES